MISDATRAAIITLAEQGIALREISRLMKLSRNTVRRVLRDQRPVPGARTRQTDDERARVIETLFARCGGNLVRVQELLREEHQCEVAYSTLTRWVRHAGLRQAKPRAGSYTFAPGEEMQHDTSPMRLTLGDHTLTAQCAALVLAYSRRLFIQFLAQFTRFEAKWFLTDAFRFMDGTTPRCVIDNTSVVVAGGSGPEADIAPEMVAFGEAFGLQFVPHRLMHPDRKARVERPFDYVQRNFLAGRTFGDWDDLNDQALLWCQQVANQKPKRALGMSPEAAYVLEKPHLQSLPKVLPPVYQTHYRVVDIEAYVSLDTNRYSVPERLIGQRVTVLKYPTTVAVYHQHRPITEHPRLIGRRETKSTLPGHHLPRARARIYHGPALEERQLTGHQPQLDQYVRELKRRAPGRGVRRLRRLVELKRSYPPEAFYAAIAQALHYGLFDLARLEQLILERVAGEFFHWPEEGLMRDQLGQLLEQLRFRGMLAVLERELDEAQRQGRSSEEVICRLLQEEYRYRQERALVYRLGQAKIPWSWTLETFPFERQPSVNQAHIRSLAGLDFVQRAENIVFIGPTGTGKSGLASGLLRQALLNGYRGRFYPAQDLLDELYASLADRSTSKLLHRLSQYDVLQIDELGYLTLNREQVNAFFKLMDMRYGRKATLITTNLDYDDWYELFQRKPLVDALLDRLQHHCITIRLTGASLRATDPHVGTRP